MFFKNAIFYQICCPADAVVSELKKRIPEAEFTPVEEGQLGSTGFIPPHQDDLLFHEQQDTFLFRIKHQARQIPASAVREMLEAKVKEIEAKESRKVYGKERLSIKDDIIQEHLPKAMPVSKTFEAYVDLKLNLLVINSAAKGASEKMHSQLAAMLGSFPLQAPVCNHSPQAAMTSWLLKSPPKNITPRNSCKLIEPGEGGAVVTIKNEDLDSDGVQQLLEEGKRVESLEVWWDDKMVRFTMADPWVLKGIHFSEDLIRDAEQEGGDELAIFDANLALMSTTLRGIFKDIGEALGGWLEQEYMGFSGSE